MLWAVDLRELCSLCKKNEMREMKESENAMAGDRSRRPSLTASNPYHFGVRRRKRITTG